MSESTAVMPRNGTALTPRVLEQLLAEGDLSKLTAAERVMHYVGTCESLGLNYRTKPFDYLKTRDGKIILYANRSAAEQLAEMHHISLTISSRSIEDDCYEVWAKATGTDGRTVENLGSVPIAGLKGEALSNAKMKAVTKAYRRTTLAYCGLGLLDESEVDSIPGARRVKVDIQTGEIIEHQPPSNSDGQSDRPAPKKAAPAPKWDELPEPRQRQIALQEWQKQWDRGQALGVTLEPLPDQAPVVEIVRRIKEARRVCSEAEAAIPPSDFMQTAIPES